MNSPDRDFRNDKWTSTVLPSNPGTRAVGKVETPSKDYRAYLIEAEFAGEDGRTYKLSTEARVTPDGPPAKNGRKQD